MPSPVLFTFNFTFFLDDADLFSAERESQQIEDQSTSLVFNSNRNLNLVAQRSKLPIKNYKNEILFCLENFQTLVIVGGKCDNSNSKLFEDELTVLF